MRDQRDAAHASPLLRFFGGFNLPAGLCDAPDLVTQGYANRVARERVVRIASGDPPPDAIDPLTCATGGRGASGLCAEWVDPGLRPRRPGILLRATT